MATQPIVPDVFHYRTLTKGINEITTRPNFLTNLILNHPAARAPLYFPTKTVEFDVKTGSQNILPFMKRRDRAIMQLLPQYTHHIVEPPTLKHGDDLVYDEIFTERWFDELALSNSIARNHVMMRINEIQTNLRERIENTIEWMLAQILTSGKITYSGDNDRFEFDFNVPTAFLDATATWKDATAITPLEDIRTWKKLINKATGFSNFIALATPDVAEALMDNTAIASKLDKRSDGSSIGFDFPRIGVLNGITIYEFDEQVIGHAGTEIDLQGASDYFILLAPEAIRMYYAASFNRQGPVMDKYYSWSEETKDPEGFKIYAQSHPVPVLEYRMGMVRATVTLS